MGYAQEDSKVRLDRFRASGKWYDTYSLDMSQFYWSKNEKHPDGHFIHDAVREAMKQNYIDFLSEEGSFVVVLEPYHENSYPIVLWNDK